MITKYKYKYNQSRFLYSLNKKDIISSCSKLLSSKAM